MATKKVASPKQHAACPQGRGGPGIVVSPTPAGEQTVKLTVKLTEDEHQRLLYLGMRTRPRRSNQDMIRAAVLQYLEEAEAEDHGPVTTPPAQAGGVITGNLLAQGHTVE